MKGSSANAALQMDSGWSFILVMMAGTNASRLAKCNMQHTIHLHAGLEIRIKGRNTVDTEFVRAGAYHTLEIEPQRPFDVQKTSWDVLDLDRLKQACDPAASADLAAVLITVHTHPIPQILALRMANPLTETTPPQSCWYRLQVQCIGAL